MARFSAVIPVVFSGVAFSLLLVLALAGSKVNTGSEYFILSLNTSKIGSETIQFNTVADPTPGITDPSGIFGGFLNGIDGLIAGVADRANAQLEKLEADIITSIIESAGIKDVYNIYMRNICEGKLAKDNNPNLLVISACPTYLDATGGLSNISSKVPSSVVIGATNVTVPILESAGKGLGTIQDLVVAGTNANFAFLVIGLISSGIVMSLSLVAIIFPRLRFITYLNLFFASLASLVLIVSAIILTIVIYFIVTMVNGVGSGLTISATGGTRVRVFSWVAWVCSTVSGTYWFLIWFVHIRRTMLVRRPRDQNDIGKWGGLIGRTRRNLSKNSEKSNAAQETPIAMMAMNPRINTTMNSNL